MASLVGNHRLPSKKSLKRGISVMKIKELVEHLGFDKINNDIYRKQFDASGCELRVNFKAKSLIYPEDKGLIVRERQTCNFKAEENYVVFECICRLLSQGYSPEHIELEPKWKVGHGASGGRGDILVKDRNGKAFLIIECKTYGTNFDDGWRKTLHDGGQLLTYAKQTDGAAKFVMLYTSEIYDTIVRDYRLITLREKGDIIGEDALFVAWKDLYNQEYDTIGVFEDDCEPYEIGKSKRTIASINPIKSDDIQKKYHEFATILRQHNVSGRENAFDKLVNLFLAKIIDEKDNPDDLWFTWKNASDTFYKLHDRIQKLYRKGMKDFLKEEVTYIDNEAIEEAFRLFKHDPDATKDTTLDYFRQLKFYTNSDFAFIDVHNESLFFQNSIILLKIIRMLQDIKLKTQEQNQFLGDLFEGFLDQGIKQSEGQFFTPTPIVKFLVSSLPLEQFVNDKTAVPYVIDYACGAGHFLNEYATQIREYIPSTKLSDYYSQIVGIEKEYRLSKVAKVSAFMYGQDEIQIVYADALASNSNIKDGTYSVLISNPPYSVKGFLETLSDEDRASFEISQVIDDKAISSNNSIEAFFIERAKQLLAPGGVAAIILPSSILSNGAAVYVKAREILLKYFDIVAIVEFGSGTFGKTGTNTVTLFLRRKAENPALADHYLNRVNAWFNFDFDKDDIFKDTYLLIEYCAHNKLAVADYKTLLRSAPCSILLETEVFMLYKEAFDNSLDIKNLRNKQFFKKMSVDEQATELHNRFVDFAREREREKLYYFMLAFSNPKHVVVVESPLETANKKAFLGYSWTTRKGQEGIKYIGVSMHDETIGEVDKEVLARLKGIKSIRTPLFNPLALSDASKINSIIRENFNGKNTGDHEYVKRFRLVDMLDYSGVKMDKTISLSVTQRSEIAGKYPLVALGAVCDVMIGGTPARANSLYYQDGTNLWLSIAEMTGQVITDTKERITDIAVNESNCKLIPQGTTLLSFKLSIGKTAIAGRDLYTNEAIAGLVPHNTKKILDKYLFCLFSSRIIDLENTGHKAFGKSLNSTYLKNDVKIPLPPINIQQDIITACEIIDEEYSRTYANVDEYRKNIEQSFIDMEEASTQVYRLNDKSLFSVSIGKRIVEAQLNPSGEVPVYSANVHEPFGYISELLINDFHTPSVLWGIDGDWQVGYIPKDTPFYPTDHCGVLRVETDKVVPRYLAWVLQKEGERFGFTRSLRASTSRVKQLTVQMPTKEQQEKIVSKVFDYERLIGIAQEKLANLAIRKQNILKEHLI